MIDNLNLYQTIQENMPKAICQLLQKCYQDGLRTLVVTKDMAASKALDNLLWSFAQKSFIPHALATDLMFSEHPIIITHESLKVQGFDVLVLVECFNFVNTKSFSRIMCFFTQEDMLSMHQLKDSLKSRQSNYYVQNSAGKWSNSLI